MKSHLRIIALRRFEDSDVHVDGIHFMDCVFERCRLITAPNADVMLEDCDVIACTPVGPWPAEIAAAMLSPVSKTMDGSWPSRGPKS